MTRDPTALPACSVIVPTRSRPLQLRRCLAALAAQRYPSAAFEVIIVDDGSAIPAEDLVSQFRAAIDIALIEQDHAGPAAARNAGAARARGRLLVFTDDDCAPDPDWLAALSGRHTASPGDAVGGSTTCAISANPFSSASQLLISYLYEYYNLQSPSGDARFLTSNNLALPRDRFLALGGFDPTFPTAAAEDRDLCDRWLRGGFRLIYAPEAVVHHSHVLTLRAFWRQHFAYGRGAYLFHRLRAQRAGHTGNSGIRVEPLRFYLNLVRYPAMCPSDERGGNARLTLVALLALSQFANVAGYLRQGLFGSTGRRGGRKPGQAADGRV